MAPISLINRSQAETLHLLTKRKKNWAHKNPGVVLVFCIVFLVGLGILSLFAYRRWMKRKANKESYETTE
jgi:predicted negative regulator of RcsB-dependent stress response